jgi:hypothetical protein
VHLKVLTLPKICLVTQIAKSSVRQHLDKWEQVDDDDLVELERNPSTVPRPSSPTSSLPQPRRTELGKLALRQPVRAVDRWR